MDFREQYSPLQVKTRRKGLEWKKRKVQICSGWRLLDEEKEGRLIRSKELFVISWEHIFHFLVCSEL